MRIYTRPLTADEIQHDMNAPVMTAAGTALAHRNLPMARLREALLGNVSPSRAPSSLGANADDLQRRRPAGLFPRTPATSAESAAMPHLIEAGEVLVTRQWQRVDFDAAFVDPVVIANTLSSQCTAAAVIIMRNVGPTGFEIRFQPWAEVEAALPSETIGFPAFERGTYTLADGTLAEAGHVTADPAKLSQDIAFSRPFNTIPVVMSAVTRTSEANPAVSQVQTITKNSLRFRVLGTSG